MSFPNIPGYRVKEIPTMGPQQKSIYDILFGAVQPNLGPGISQLGQLARGAPGAFKDLEAPALRQFQQITAPRLAEAQTAGGRGLSSGYLNRLTQAGQDFAQNLQSQRLGLQQNALAQLLGLGQNLMNTQTSQPFITKRRSTQFLEGLGNFAGQLPGLALGLGNLFSGGSTLRNVMQAVKPQQGGIS